MRQPNLVLLTRFIAEHGSESIKIHEIPQSDLWIVSQKKDRDSWEIVLCNPHTTTKRIIHPNIETEALSEIWTEMKLVEAEKRLRDIVSSAKKVVNNYYKNNKQ